MPDSSIEFASLLCSRLCHDLLSPVGAMSNGLELLADEDDPAMREQCLALLADSARASAERLKFFRLAFGAGGGFGDSVNAADVRAAIEGIARANSRLELSWMIERAELPKDAAKILLNLAMIAVEALVRGGRIDIGAEGGEVVVRAEGPRLAIDDEVREILAGGGDEQGVTSRTSVAWLARKLAQAAGGRLELADQEEGVLVLAAILPA